MSGLISRIQRGAGRFLHTALTRFRSGGWEPHSRLFLVSDGNNWVLSEEILNLLNVTDLMRVNAIASSHFGGARNQGAYFASLHTMMNWQPWRWQARSAASYYHGTPGTGDNNFDHQFDLLCKYHEQITALHVTNSRFRETVITSGIAPEKLHLISIGIDLNRYSVQSPDTREAMRSDLGIPQDAIVIGSFQKDGDGWGEGLTPKLVKGPDIFLEVIDQIRSEHPKLHVLLSGPARGYVKAGLDKMDVPHTHLFLDNASDVDALYHALDLYLITSREEGGPKAVMESMASGVPLVSTRVGMAPDLIHHGKSGWLADVGDVDTLARLCNDVIALPPEAREAHVYSALCEVERVDLPRLTPQWRELFAKLVDEKHIGIGHG